MLASSLENQVQEWALGLADKLGNLLVMKLDGRLERELALGLGNKLDPLLEHQLALVSALEWALVLALELGNKLGNL